MSVEFLKKISDMGGWTSQTCDLFFKLPDFLVGFFKEISGMGSWINQTCEQ
jgi:hypothetical protein